MRRSYIVALGIANEFIEMFVKGKYEIAGSLRRKETTIGDVDVIVNETLDVISERIANYGKCKKVNGGEKKMDVDYKGTRFNIYFAEPKYWGSMLFFLTGPAGYSIAYRRKAKAKGWVLNQYGLFDERKNLIAAKTEKEIYKAFDKDYKKPEMRGI